MTHPHDSGPTDESLADGAETDTQTETAEPIPSADTRSVFAAALEKKKAAGQARSSHLDGHGVDGSHTNSKATRQFRRKSGGGG